MNGSLFSGFLFGRRGFLRREKHLSTVDSHEKDSTCPPDGGAPPAPAPAAAAAAGGTASRDHPDNEEPGGGEEANDNHHHHHHHHQQQQQQQGGLLIQMPKNVRYVVLRHGTTADSPEEEEENEGGSVQKSPDCHLRPQLRKSPGAHHAAAAAAAVDRAASPVPPSSSSCEDHHRGGSPCHSPERDATYRRPSPSSSSYLSPSFRPSRLSSFDGGLGLGPGLGGEPCRIVVETEDSPIDSTRPGFGGGDSRRNSSSSMGEGCAGGGSRRGSMSPKDQRAKCPPGGTVSSFLWGLGLSNNAPSTGVEDQFWVPENIIQKKRANSVASPAFLDTATSEFAESGRRLCASLDYSSSDRLKGLGASASPSAAAAAAATTPGPWSSAEGQLTVAAAVNQKLRRASMHSALDHTKIDASMYERPPPLSTQKPHGIVQEDNIGSIHFRLTFDPDRSVLAVLLYQGVDLVPRADGTSASKQQQQQQQSGVFARISLLPDPPVPSVTSQVHNRTLSPKFEEDFVFDVSRRDVAKKTLEIAVMFGGTDDDDGGGGDCAGHVLLPLDQVDLSEPIYLWKGLSHFEGRAQVAAVVECPGELLLSVSYLSSAERLTIIVTKAKNLLHTDSPSKPVTNPYVRVTLFHGARKLKRKKTTTKRSGTNPEWNEALVFNLTRDLFDSVQAEAAVFSENILGTDEPVGRVVFGSTVSGMEQFHWMSAHSGRSAPSAWFKMTSVE